MKKFLPTLFFSLAAHGLLHAAGPSAVSTFNCIGIYWSPPGGSTGGICNVNYRKQGTTQWRAGLGLWFDGRNGEYRGSIVSLTPNTTYEMQLAVQGVDTVVFTAKTWTENFPVAKTIVLPVTSSSILKIDSSGSPAGYLLYTCAPGGSAVIDGNNKIWDCVEISGSYVILRGVTIKNPQGNGILLKPGITDVVIEGCDISGWGSIASDGWGANMNLAIGGVSPSKLKRIVIQRNKMHHPRSNSNNWSETRPTTGSSHPSGPQAVGFFNSEGNHVIRYNEVYSDINHYLNDGIGAGANFSDSGFPGFDSDIHGNYFANCWDDAIESEGANRNVRIWGNFIEKTYTKIATASTTRGPLYLWRNIFGIGGKTPTETATGIGMKNESKGLWGGGRKWFFHNTFYVPLTYCIGWHEPENIYCRNNVIRAGSAMIFGAAAPDNSFDYDVYNGSITNAPAGSESHGKMGTPVYRSANKPFTFGGNGKGEYYLDPASPGFDKGEIIPNFNDGFAGAAPDMGAHENGSLPMEFGVKAYLDTPTTLAEVSPASKKENTAISATPNPFRSSTALRFSGEAPEKVSVYDLRGRRIAGLAVKGGRAIFEGKDAQGRALTPGIYTVIFEAGTRMKSAKLFLVD